MLQSKKKQNGDEALNRQRKQTVILVNFGSIILNEETAFKGKAFKGCCED